MRVKKYGERKEATTLLCVMSLAHSWRVSDLLLVETMISVSRFTCLCKDNAGKKLVSPANLLLALQSTVCYLPNEMHFHECVDSDKRNWCIDLFTFLFLPVQLTTDPCPICPSVSSFFLL